MCLLDESPEDPFQRDDAQNDETVHNGSQDILVPHHPAVEEGKTRRHEHHQGGGHQNKSGISSIHDMILLFIRDMQYLTMQ